MVFHDSTNLAPPQMYESPAKKKPSLMNMEGSPDGTFSTAALDFKHHSDSKYLSSSVISPRIQHSLNMIKDPMLRIKRSIERFGRDLIDVA